MILKLISKELRPYVLEAFKEAVTLDEDTLNRVYFETLTDEVPLWLWIEKAIADIKKALKGESLSSFDSKLNINKLNEKKKLIESAFIVFGRRAILISPTGAKELIKAIYADDDLSFLYSACLYLTETCNEFVQSQKITSTDVSDKIMNVEFDSNLGISTAMDIPMPKEDNKTNDSNENDCDSDDSNRDDCTLNDLNDIDKPVKKTIIIEGSISPDELSQFLSQKLTELFQNKVQSETLSSSKATSKIKYQVQKVWLDSQIETTLTSYNSEEEAMEFIERAKKAMPEYKGVWDLKIKKIQS